MFDSIDHRSAVLKRAAEQASPTVGVMGESMTGVSLLACRERDAENPW